MSRSNSAMSSPALRLVIEPHHLKHSSNISLLIARHTFGERVHQWKRVRLSVEPEPVVEPETQEKDGEAEPQEKEGEAREPDPSLGSEPKEGSVSAVEQPLEQEEAQACEPEPEEGSVPKEEEGEARAELPSFNLETMGVKSPDMGRLRPLVSRQKLTIPDLCLFDKEGRVVFVVEVCIILPASFSCFQSPILHIYTDKNAPK